MILLDGKQTAASLEAETLKRIAQLQKRGITPGLAVVLIGENPASQAYVRNKDRTCSRLGMLSRKLELPASTTQKELLEVIDELNEDPLIHGILVQSPPPSHIDEKTITLAIDPKKDVDGFHPINVAKLAMDDPAGFVPCTPLGCQHLLKAYDIRTRGAHVVVVGRSLIVGKPMALLLLQKGLGGDATVTIAHSQTRDLAAITRSADIVIAALGRAHALGAEHIREGAVVIDVGINRIDDASKPCGYRLVGDVDFESVKEKCYAITPVPGGVGPMTIAMLMQNTVTACERFTQ
ncbi:MAG: bifunctional methylenetetrahydrofolate dehydrogenase/methenyltetrahydrofolate cyclohydrolase FolD [Verrucomicrobiae bacterium]|jgi:methylenetetrahydrofolate dehydrogenase (NADP+)/methenyltetrahydrofolate cyclohydrolase|nr:bifunctional methylenetetrahydrofolate dehydrogenase/methenyltetrahydrofolate cyclohydrolase FolD [Verrucomicrobiae bacterium]